MMAAFRILGAAAALAASALFAAPVAVPVAMLGGAVFASVAEAAVVSRVEVRGNQRVDAETIRSYVPIQPGQNFSGADIDEGIKKLFATGLFSDVQIDQAGGALVIQVTENAIVNQVLFQGNKKIKDADLTRAVQVKPRGSYSAELLAQDVDAVKAAYSRIGRDDAEVTTQIVDLGENRVNVVFNINEGGRTKISAINFEGNSTFSDRRLSEVISTKRSSLLSYVFRDDVYDADRLRADEEALRRFYYNRGFADFQVISSSADLDAAGNTYNISIVIDEGQRYRFGDIAIESSIPDVDGESLRGLVQSRSGTLYSADDVEDTIVALTERMAGMGYAFAQVTPRGDRNFETRTISVAYAIDQGQRTYIERIEIRGNTQTRDYVIRREFDVSEGDAFNQVLIQRAKRRLEKLDYFTSVNVSTAPGSQPDQVILVVDVIDKSTGEFAAGAGYSTGESSSGGAGVNVTASVSERNYLGRGQFIRFSAGGGANSRDYSFAFTEPYFLGRRIAAGFDVYRQTREYDDYDSETLGGSIRFGLPITNALSSSIAYNLSQEEYNLNDDCDANGDGLPDADCSLSTAIVDGIANSPWVKSSVSASLTYNTIDDVKNPHDGLFATFSTEVAGLGGDAEFIKFTTRGTAYRTLSEEQDIVGLISLGAGHIEGFGDNDLRVFDYFKSSDRMIRGFSYNGIGPRDCSDNDGEGDCDFLGGSTYANASAEAQFPLPGVPSSIGLRGAVFADAATLFGNDLSQVDAGTADMQFRASVGASVIWASPFGPLRIDYAMPILKEEGDEVENFNFGVSTRF